MNKTLKLIYIVIFMAVAMPGVHAQKVTIGTDFLQWGNFGTANIEAGFALSQHFSLSAGARYNPWEFKTDNPHLLMQNQQQTYHAGLRFWPWYVFSGWWFGVKAQYQSFCRSGVWRPALETGRGIGGGLSAGYTLMLTKSLNMEFGAGVWGGRLLERTLYDCPLCLNIREQGAKNFINIDNISVSLYYIF